jgi:hypothetical protein
LLVSGPNLFAGTQGGIFISTDDGANWSARNNGLTEGKFVNDFVYALAQVGSALFAGTSPNGVYRSDDNGGSWGKVNSGISVPEINALTSIGTDLFTGTMEGGVYHSSDNGDNWQQVNGGLTATQVDRLVAIGGTLYAGTPSDGAFMSSDMGISWTAINNGFASTRYVSGFSSSGTYLFVTKDDDGVYVSADNGAHWSAKSEGLSDKRIRAIVVSGSDVLVGGFTATISKRSLASMTSSGVEISATTNAHAQNYPNPFTGSTTIRFTSSGREFVTVTVVNQLGAEVSRIYSGDLDAGEHSFGWSAPSGLSTGMYECIVRMSNQTQEIPLVINR